LWLPWPDLRELTLFLAVSLRLGATLSVVPFFRSPGLSPLWRGALTIVLSLALTPAARASLVARGLVLPLPLPEFWPRLLVIGVSELIIGFVLGFLVLVAFSAVEMAGTLLDLPLGFSMDTLFDPVSGFAAPLLGRFFNLLALVLFSLVGGVDALVNLLVVTLLSLPPGLAPNVVPATIPVWDYYAGFFALGFRLALPLVAALLVTDVALGLLARAVPPLNLFSVGFSVKQLGGFILLLILLPFMVKAIGAVFEPGGPLWRGIDQLWQIIAGNIGGSPARQLVLLPFAFDLQLFAEDDKTEAPTPRRREEGRRQGQVARTPEIGVGLALVAVAFSLRALAPVVSDVGLRLGREDWQMALGRVGVTGVLGPNTTVELFGPFLRDGLLLLLPILLPAMLAVIAAQAAQTGLLVTPALAAPRLERLNPLAGLARLFSWQGAASLLKSLLKALVIGYAAYSVLRANYTDLPRMAELPAASSAGLAASWLQDLFYRVGFATCLVGLADYAFQRVQLEKQLRMSRQEVRDELKQTEGDPQIKARLRQRQRQLARNRQIQEVRRADVLVVNPVHVAVALKYEAGTMRAPRVVAKGAGVVARRLREIAMEAGVPVVENPPLARALYRSVKVGREIPVELYQAVAELLAYVYRRHPHRRPRQ